MGETIENGLCLSVIHCMCSYAACRHKRRVGGRWGRPELVAQKPAKGQGGGKFLLVGDMIQVD